jgi:hypothetical protein
MCVSRSTGNTKTLKIDPTAQAAARCCQHIQPRQRANRQRQRLELLVAADPQFLKRREAPDRLWKG